MVNCNIVIFPSLHRVHSFMEL